MDSPKLWDKATKERWGRRLKVLRPFDPYHSDLCTCAPKLTVNIYNGCGFECFYCYTSSYARGRWGHTCSAWSARPNVVECLKADIARIGGSSDPELALLAGLPVVLSLSSDPYPNSPHADESSLGLTRQCLAALSEAGYSILMQTKSDLFRRDLDVLSPGRAVIGVTITTADPDLARRMEPYCPAPEARLAALKAAADRGFATLCRVDPIVAGLNDDLGAIDRLVGALADAGVRHIVSSTYKKRADSARRFAERFPEIESATRSWYETQAVAGYYYLREEHRRRLMAGIAESAGRHRVSFATCRERFTDLHFGSCDGRHLLKAH